MNERVSRIDDLNYQTLAYDKSSWLDSAERHRFWKTIWDLYSFRDCHSLHREGSLPMRDGEQHSKGIQASYLCTENDLSSL
jgi:hypothetical protein